MQRQVVMCREEDEDVVDFWANVDVDVDCHLDMDMLTGHLLFTCPG